MKIDIVGVKAWLQISPIDCRPIAIYLTLAHALFTEKRSSVVPFHHNPSRPPLLIGTRNTILPLTLVEVLHPSLHLSKSS